MARYMVLVLLALGASARAQEYPAREIRSICNFAAGSGADIMERWGGYVRLAKIEKQ